MFSNKVVYCEENWKISWDWSPKDWCTFGWHTMPYDSVVYKALNLGRLSIYNEWEPVELDDNVIGSKNRTSEEDDKQVGGNPGE